MVSTMVVTRERVDTRQAIAPLAVAGLAVIATIHGLDVSGKLDETFYLGVMFIMGPIVSALVAAALLMSRHERLGWALAGLVSAGTFAGYCVSRTTGLPSAKDDIGNWGEPAGVISLVAEGVVVLLAVYALRNAVRADPGKQ
jgi:hypothetical protein